MNSEEVKITDILAKRGYTITSNGIIIKGSSSIEYIPFRKVRLISRENNCISVYGYNFIENDLDLLTKIVEIDIFNYISERFEKYILSQQ